MKQLRYEARESLEAARAASASRIQELESAVDVLETERANVIAEKQQLSSVSNARDETVDACIRELEATIVQQQQDSRATASQSLHSKRCSSRAETKRQQLEATIARFDEGSHSRHETS
jgi:hypothetical protein